MAVTLVRVGSPEQAELWRELRNQGHGDPVSQETYERLRQMAPNTLDLIAELDGKPVGVGFAAPNLVDPEGPSAHAGGFVLPEHRRRGVGTALLPVLSAHAEALGKTCLDVAVPGDDPDGLTFLTKRGFELLSRGGMTVLDLSPETVPEPAPLDGVEIVSLAQRPEAVHGMYEVAREALPDIPGENVTVSSFESWRQIELEQTLAIPELTLVAYEDGEVIGYATLGDYGDGQGLHLMTGVRRSARGRGLAGALKRAQIGAAHTAGLGRLVAFNNEKNEPIRRLNAALGYVPQPPMSVLRGPLVR